MGLLPRFVTWFVDEKYDSYCATFPPPEAYPVKVLVITCSPMKEGSASIEMVNYFLSEYKKVRPQDVVEVLDLTAGELPPFSAAHAAVKYSTWGASKEPPVELKDDWEYTTALIERLITYDKFIFGVSMWNMTFPHTLKLFFDHIIQPHLVQPPACQCFVPTPPR
ncbi:hypothetical protein CYMTET_44948 [Cymbomonas tetramitiformis]|uniref:Flavodoxin-like fold domain-containing protein n=1 Tax=Cymbomonas tetramitiformis TaxID=36881 RepID=A0AAE0EZ28_9CHLO|nr:hypothetical protein CYMTET_44948 [Cymbomonas tetramitiformis]